MKIIGIYTITSPSKKIYVGQSKDIHKRWKAYFGLHCKPQKLIYNSLKKYGVKNHKFEIIFECDKSNLLDYEEDYIYLLNTQNGYHGLNLSYSEDKIKKEKLSKTIIEERKRKKTEYMKKYTFQKNALSSISNHMFRSRVKRGLIKLPNLCFNIDNDNNDYIQDDSPLPF